MPLPVGKKINSKWNKTYAHIIQLDRTHVPSIGELRDVIIWSSTDGQVHQCINIVIVEILEAYGVSLSIDWSSKLQGYFAIDWSHLWILYKGENNQIRVE